MTWTDLPMVMNTGNRPRMFQDAIEQYAATAPGLKALVADFGEGESQRSNAAVAARHPETVEYHSFESGVPYVERCRFLLERCPTPYVVMAADDDFFLPEGLLACVTFMREHDDYSAYHGFYFDVTPLQKPATLNLTPSWGTTSRGHESADPTGRVMSLL
jgi:glycosyltransferase domain-containing protein